MKCWDIEMYEIVAKASYRAINIRCMRFLRELRTELLVWDVEMYEIFARTSYRAINMRCMKFLRKLRIELLIWDVWNFCENFVSSYWYEMLRSFCKSDAMLRRRKRRNVAKKNDAKTKTTKCKQSYCNVSSFKNKFFVQVRKYIRSLMQKNNCEIENFDVLEIYN
jgi:hypothetical protein